MYLLINFNVAVTILFDKAYLVPLGTFMGLFGYVAFNFPEMGSIFFLDLSGVADL